MRRRSFALIAFMLALAPWHRQVQADAAHYTIENLGTFGGLVPTITGINASGQISGFVENAAGPRAVRYSSGSWSYLQGLEAVDSYASGINDAGVIAGYGSIGGMTRAFRYQNGTVEQILPLTGGTFTAGYAINNAGVVVGYADTPAGYVAYSAAPGGQAVELPGMGGSFTLACGINDAGQIAGWGYTTTMLQHAFRLEPGAAAPVDLESFNGPAGQSDACAIDADGRVGGRADSPQGSHAFRFGASLVDLDTFGSPSSNTASTMGGTSVGFYSLGSGTSAFVHTAADGTSDLNSLMNNGAGWVLTAARAVNAAGTIVGEGTFNGVPSVFRLTKLGSVPADTTAPVISGVTANPSTIGLPNGSMVSVSLSVAVTDVVDPAPVCALTSISSAGSTAGDYAVTGPLAASVKAVGGRNYSLTVTCTDASGNASTATTVVDVLPDTTAPVISEVSATPSFTWPPNGKMVPVSVSVSATDNVDASPVCALESITGAPAGDFVITGPFTANVRAEKNQSYELHVKCTDSARNRSYASATVTVANKDEILKKLVK